MNSQGTNPALPDPILTAIVDDQEITGRFIHRSESELEVAIDTPFSGFTGTMRCTTSGGDTPQTGWAGEEGVIEAKGILEHLYRLMRHLHEHRDDLVAAFDDNQSRLVELHVATDALSDHFFMLAKENLGKDLEKGRVSYGDLEVKMVELRSMHSRFHEKLGAIRQEFFEVNFPFAVGESVRDQVMVWLRRESSGKR